LGGLYPLRSRKGVLGGLHLFREAGVNSALKVFFGSYGEYTHKCI